MDSYVDPYFGNSQDPQSFHKYLYTHANPIAGVDPTGREFSAISLTVSISVGAVFGGTISALRGGSFWEGAAWGAIGGAFGGLAFPFLAGWLGASTSLVGWYSTMAATGFFSGAMTGGLQSWWNNKNAADIVFDALESGVIGAAVALAFAPFLVPKTIPRQGSVSNANFAQPTNLNEVFSPDGQAIYSQLAGRSIQTVDDLAYALEAGHISPEQVPLDYVVNSNGVKLVLNTRTSMALTRAGVPKSRWYGRDQTGQRVPNMDETTFDELCQRQLRKNHLQSDGTPNQPN